MEKSSYELIKSLIVNDQLGNLKDLKLVVMENSLPKEVKEQIWEVILYNVRQGRGGICELAKQLKESFILINS